MTIISKWLARIEHKIDLILEGMATQYPFLELRQFGDSSHLCGLCREPVKYYVDTQERQIARRCGCVLGLQVPIDPASLMPSPQQPTANHQGVTRDEESD